MVQIQSTLFPLYDRNPQTFIANPLDAAPADYKAQTIRISHSAEAPSAVWLPTVP
jgi:predicted acyl esterase